MIEEKTAVTNGMHHARRDLIAKRNAETDPGIIRLTPQPRDVEAATPDQTDLAGAPGMEVTPAMVHAGVMEFWSADTRCEGMDEILARVFRRMIAVKG